jgi:hypothetical protein
MTALNSKKNNKKKYALISFKKINFILISLLILIGALNLSMSNDMVVKGFKIRDLNREFNLLAEENRILESNLMAMKSYDVLKSNINKLKLVSAKNVKHLSAKESSMARR